MPSNPNDYPVLAFGLDTAVVGTSYQSATIQVSGVLTDTWFLQSKLIAPGEDLPIPVEGVWGWLDTKGIEITVIASGILGFDFDAVGSQILNIVDPANAGRMYVMMNYEKLPNLVSDCGALQEGCTGLRYGFGNLRSEWETGPGIVGYMQLNVRC